MNTYMVIYAFLFLAFAANQCMGRNIRYHDDKDNFIRRRIFNSRKIERVGKDNFLDLSEETVAEKESCPPNFLNLDVANVTKQTRLFKLRYGDSFSGTFHIGLYCGCDLYNTKHVINTPICPNGKNQQCSPDDSQRITVQYNYNQLLYCPAT
ncbi:hypothetical protein I4U23_010961 [Adineta vaga]|nr:hypothetical protein I4U23_010961 [Adineta vaga]